jgi:Na+/glutamate symporter
MKERWLPVGVLAGVLFGINVLARLVARFAFADDTELQDRLSLAMFATIGLVLATLAFIRGQRRPLPDWGGEMALAVLIAMVLTIFVGPFVSGTQPFASGAGAFFSQIWLYAGFTAGGVLLGYLLLTALGRDHRSRSLKRFAEAKQAKPRRVVRR